MARKCHKPNPRLKDLSASQPLKPTLSSILKRKMPEANLVQPEADQILETVPETSVVFGTARVPVEANGNYTPFVYPNGSSNHMLKGYSYEELNRGSTPYGT